MLKFVVVAVSVCAHCVRGCGVQYRVCDLKTVADELGQYGTPPDNQSHSGRDGESSQQTTEGRWQCECMLHSAFVSVLLLLP